MFLVWLSSSIQLLRIACLSCRKHRMSFSRRTNPSYHLLKFKFFIIVFIVVGRVRIFFSYWLQTTVARERVFLSHRFCFSEFIFILTKDWEVGSLLVWCLHSVVFVKFVGVVMHFLAFEAGDLLFLFTFNFFAAHCGEFHAIIWMCDPWVWNAV